MNYRKIVSAVVLVMSVFCLASFEIFSQPVRVRLSQLGVTPDAGEVNTARIQYAIDYAAHRGMQLVVDSGDYVCGTLHLPSGSDLYLDAGSRLLGSIDPYDYEGYSLADTVPLRGFITANKVSDISISGPGTIDGRGLAVALAVDSLHHIGERPDPGYSKRRMRPSLRPKLLDFKDVDGLFIEGLSLRSSAAWGLSLSGCSHVVIRDIDFENRAYWNNDGIDVADCHGVLIENCNINSADDGIVLKSFNPESGNDSIVVRNCTVRSSASAVKIGTESFGAFRNIEIRDIRVLDTFRSAIAIETVDGAVLEDVLVDGIEADNTGNALFIRLGHRRGDAPGILRRVTVRNLFCRVADGRPDSAYDLRGPDINVIHNPFPASITGIPSARISDLLLENIRVEYPGGGTKGMGYVGRYRWKDIPEAVGDYPEFHMFGELPAWAFYIRHVDGITFRNVEVSLRRPDYREPVVMDDVTGIDGDIIAFPATNHL